MDLCIDGYSLRELEPRDAVAIARHADDPDIAAQLRDRFPHPYNVKDAESFIAMVAPGQGELAWAVDHKGEPVGVIGAVPGQDVYRDSWEIGYWLGRRHWGRGVATAAVRVLSLHLFRTRGVVRLWAGVFESNPASARVLEKAGYRREGVHRSHVRKHGRLMDEWVYARLVTDPQEKDPAG